MKSDVRVWLGGSTVERHACNTIAEAKKLAQQLKREWRNLSPRASVLYTNKDGMEVYA